MREKPGKRYHEWLHASLKGAILGIACIAAPLAAGVKDGVDAWSAGDFDRAVEEWRLPAQQGDADALFNLGQAYRLGRGVDVDMGRALELYEMAARKGHVKAANTYGLLLFQHGDRKAAMPLIDAAAARGDARARYVLGLAHFNGDFAAKDWVRAYALMSLAEKAGLPPAREALEQMNQYVAQEQRQQALGLMPDIEARTAERLAASLPAAGTEPVSAPAGQAVRGQPAAIAPRASSDKALSVGNWSVQLGAFGVPGNAERLWRKLSSRAVLAGRRMALVPSGQVTILRAAGFATRRDASSACAALKKTGQECIVTRS